MIAGLLILSIILQLAAAVLALRLIPVFRGRVAWVLIASAFTLWAMPLFKPSSAAADDKGFPGKSPPRMGLGNEGLLNFLRVPLRLICTLLAGLLISGCIEIVKIDREGRKPHLIRNEETRSEETRSEETRSEEAEAPRELDAKWVVARHGLLLRETPALSGGTIAAIPFGEKVGFIEEVGEPFTVEGEKGRWSKVVYKGNVGYSFGGFMADAPVVSESRRIPASTDAPPRQKPGDALSIQEENRELRFAYAKNDSPQLIKMRIDDFKKELLKIEEDFESKKDDFMNSARPRTDNESAEQYLDRAQRVKEKILNDIRGYEYMHAQKVYSIYDATFEHGNYSNILGKFDFIGTTIEFKPVQKISTYPANTMFGSGFSNGRKYWVKMPADKAGYMVENAEDLLVRIDFRYTESVYDILGWARNAYFLPKYLMVYNRKTGEILYECGASHRVEIGSDAVAPLRVGGDLLYEKVH